MDIIRENKVKLIRWLRADDLILQHVQSGNLITMDEYTKLKTISDPGTQITELLDLMLQKEDNVCIKFLDLLKDDDVNESSPALREWIRSVNTTSGRQAPPQASAQSPADHSVDIRASHGSNVCAPTIINSMISSLNMDIHFDMALNNKRRITDNEEFLRRNQGKLIDKVKNVDRIVDDLHLTGEMAANVRAERTDEAKMRKLLGYTNSKKAAQLLVDALYEHAADVMEELTTA